MKAKHESDESVESEVARLIEEGIGGTVNIGTEDQPIWQSVADGSLIDSTTALEGSESAFEGHVDPRFSEEQAQARAVIEKYCDILPSGEPGLPRLVKYGSFAKEVDVTTGKESESFLIRHIARANGWAMDKAYDQLLDQWVVSCQLNQRLKSEHLIGEQSISLDLVPDGEFPQDRGHPTAPKVVIVAIPKSVKACAPLHFPGEQEYMAVWYVPNQRSEVRIDPFTSMPEQDLFGNEIVDIIALDRDGEVRQPVTNGRLYADDRWLPGYKGVVAWFGSYTDAKNAHRELLQAIRTIAKPPVEADVPEEMREVLLAQYEQEDSEFAKWQATRGAIPVAPPVNPFK